MTVTQATTDRAERLASLLPDAEVDVLLVTDLFNVRYLTGYTGSNGLAVVGPQTRAFITDFRYVTQAADQIDPSFDRREASRELADGIEQVLPAGPVRLGFEETNMSVRDHRRLREMLPERVELIAAEGLVERLRAVKEAVEVARIRESTRLADDALAAVLVDGLAGRTERQVAFALAIQMHGRGAARPSFETIVAAGPHGALPHATPRDVEIGPGELVVIDWGAELDGYCSDCTRTLAAGAVGTDEREIYQLVLEAQLTGVDGVKAGIGVREVDSAAREVIESAGRGEHFGHGLGHGVGLEVHERPRLTQRSDAVLEAGNVVTVEPGVYLPDRFGVRIEDLVVVTAEGCEILTSVSKELTVIA
jgi:Xaa-Pro aminopeptidase